MKTVSRESVYLFWQNDIAKNNADYLDCGELNTTMMGEQAAEYFGVISETGETAIEQDIFDWAVDFAVKTKRGVV